MWKTLGIVLCVVAAYALNPAVASDAHQGVAVKAAYVPLLAHADPVDTKQGRLSLPGDIIFDMDRILDLSEVSRLIVSRESDTLNIVFVMCPEAAQALLQTPGFRASGPVGPRIMALNSESSRPQGLPTADEPSAMSRTLQGMLKTRVNILKRYASDPLVITALQKANAQPKARDEIDRLDQIWCERENSEFVQNTLNSSASLFLRKKVKSNKMLYTEAFLCDQQGGIVGAYPRTSDYDQGDEQKFIQCYANGQGRIFTGPLKFDKSTEANSVQMSVPVMQGDACIGVLVMGLRNLK